MTKKEFLTKYQDILEDFSERHENIKDRSFYDWVDTLEWFVNSVCDTNGSNKYD